MLDAYSYDLPEELIAKAPAEPRDSSRLFAYSTAKNKINDAVFRDIADYVAEGALFVFNTTRVVPARAVLARPIVTNDGHVSGGGKVELLFLVNEYAGGQIIQAMSDRGIAAGEILSFASGQTLRTIGNDKNVFSFELGFSPSELFAVLDQNGTTPLPSYIKGSPLNEAEARERYQSMFAETPASAAAPTASLHFTDSVIASLRAKGCDVAFVTLHVGLGTFAPVGEKELASGELHAEPYSISAETVAQVRAAKSAGKPVIAVGSTVARALETAGALILGPFGPDEPVSPISGITKIFIRPGYAFKVVDALVTNFHVPRSSLMLFVDAFLQYKKAPRDIMSLYAHAIKERYRFFSFGDAMFLF